MENSTPVDLDQALLQWRASLQNLGGFQAEELEELEGHLRESISLLHTRGLSVQEAFMIATRRLGSERQLSAEFAKANPQRTWTRRAMWMAGGVLAALALHAVTAPIGREQPVACIGFSAGILHRSIAWSGSVFSDRC